MAVACCQQSAAASLPLSTLRGRAAWHSCPSRAGSAAALRFLRAQPIFCAWMLNAAPLLLRATSRLALSALLLRPPLVPFPRRGDNVIELGDLRSPLQLACCACRIADQSRRISRSSFAELHG